MSKTLPKNCRIERLEHSTKDRAFVLIFEAEEGDDYRSEVYYPAKGQRLEAAALDICRRYNWLDFPPASGILADTDLHKLRDLVDAAIEDMEGRPERYVPDAEEAWKAAFEWTEGEFYCDGDDILSCGDAPVAEPDGDRDAGWAFYSYATDIGRFIPRSVAGRKHAAAARKSGGPRGIEVMRFISVDCDGDREIEAEFVRIQPGAVVGPEDRERLKKAVELKDKACKRYHATPDGHPKKNERWKSWHRASSKADILKIPNRFEVDEECWDPQDFQYHYTTSNCYWTLLRYKRYAIDCALSGEDPGDTVYAEHEKVHGVFRVKFRSPEKVEVTLVEGRADLEPEARDYVKNHTLAELKEIYHENPEGRPISEDRFGSLRKGWTPVKITVGSVEIEVTISGSRTLPVTPERIRKVMCRRLDEEVRRLLDQIEKHFPEPKGGDA